MRGFDASARAHQKLPAARPAVPPGDRPAPAASTGFWKLLIGGPGAGNLMRHAVTTGMTGSQRGRRPTSATAPHRKPPVPAGPRPGASETFQKSTELGGMRCGPAHGRADDGPGWDITEVCGAWRRVPLWSRGRGAPETSCYRTGNLLRCMGDLLRRIAGHPRCTANLLCRTANPLPTLCQRRRRAFSCRGGCAVCPRDEQARCALG